MHGELLELNQQLVSKNIVTLAILGFGNAW